jgi:hypothetical protein
MNKQVTSDVNPVVREVYEELGDLLEQSDAAFVEEGPAVLKRGIKRDGFFEGVTTAPALPNEYTREKVIGDEGRHVIRFMEWPPEYALMPHEHHGRPCFEVLVDGHLVLSDLKRTRIGDNEYTFEVLETTIAEPGESAVIDPRENEIHAVYSPVRSRSLHIYPDDNYESYGYILNGDDYKNDVYERKEFQLRDPEE